MTNKAKRQSFEKMIMDKRIELLEVRVALFGMWWRERLIAMGVKS